MLRNVIILALFFVVAVFYSASAQHSSFSTSNKKAIKLFQSAEKSFTLGEFSEAQKLLEASVKKDVKFTEAWLLLGDLYTELGYYTKAIKVYQEALHLSPSSLSYIYYLIANLEFMIGNYEIALDQYELFLDSENLTDVEIENTKHKIQKSKAAVQIIQNPLDTKLNRLGNSVNSAVDEYINFVDEKTKFLYLTRKEENPNYQLDGNPFKEKFYYSSNSGNGWDSLRIYPLPIDKNLNTGALNFSIDRRQLFFTGCSWPNSFGSCDLFQIQKTGTTWIKAKNLGSNVNSKYWDSQAILSSDGKTLYFASKRSGGYGGSDIWKSELKKDGSWEQPINLGDSINTSGNEMAPYIHADTKTFYFSSDGQAGLGGYDLFISRLKDDGSWEEAENLGYPVNSTANEINIFISIDATQAWISSDREDGYGGFDIYEFETKPSIKPAKVVYAKGVVVDQITQKPLHAFVELTDLKQNKSIILLESDSTDGSFFIPIYPGTEYAFNISKNGYLFYSENYNFKDSLLFASTEKIFELTPIQQGNSLVLKNLFFDFDSDMLKSASFPELNLLVLLMQENSEIKISINGHTDSIGNDTYNKSLSERRALAVRNYLIKRNIDASRLFSEGFGSSRPIDSNETLEGRATNRRTEIVIM